MNVRFLAVIAGLVVGCSKPDRSPPPTAKVEVGAPAPTYTAATMAGDTVSLAGQRGKVVLLNMWATWCGPCRKEIPLLREIHAKYKGRGLELIGVSVDAEGSGDAINDFLKEFRMDYTIWRDPNDGASVTFRLAGLPATFLVDKSGVLRWKTTGALEPGDSTLTRAIEAALK